MYDQRPTLTLAGLLGGVPSRHDDGHRVIRRYTVRVPGESTTDGDSVEYADDTITPPPEEPK